MKKGKVSYGRKEEKKGIKKEGKEIKNEKEKRRKRRYFVQIINFSQIQEKLLANITHLKTT